MRDRLNVRKNELEQEVMALRSEVDRGKMELGGEKEKRVRLEGKGQDLERIIDEQEEMIKRWELKKRK